MKEYQSKQKQPRYQQTPKKGDRNHVAKAHMGYRHSGGPNTVKGRFNIGIDQKDPSYSQGHHGLEQNQITQILNLKEFDSEAVVPLNRIMPFLANACILSSYLVCYPIGGISDYPFGNRCRRDSRD